MQKQPFYKFRMSAMKHKNCLKGKTKTCVTLAEVANALNEVMVVAYGTQKKETLTGAISSVKTDGLLRSPMQVLQVH